MTINIGLEESVRQQIAQHLGLILADMYVLYTKTLNFHWNMLDPRFYSLHLFLEKLYEEIAENIDEVAERIRMLGEKAPATLKKFVEMATLKESNDLISGEEMLLQLIQDHEALIRHLRDRIEDTDNLRDHGTSDLLIKFIRFHEKSAWMLRSHFPQKGQ